MTPVHAVALALGLAAVAVAAQAQPPTSTRATPSQPADPADPRAAVPRVEIRPALAGYQRHAPPEARSWREVNDNVTRIGGWRTYLRQAQEPDPPAAPAAPAAAASAPPKTLGPSHRHRQP